MADTTSSPMLADKLAEVAPGLRPAPAAHQVDTPSGSPINAWRWVEPAELVLIHGGAQNAHTWDTVGWPWADRWWPSTSPATATRLAADRDDRPRPWPTTWPRPSAPGRRATTLLHVLAWPHRHRHPGHPPERGRSPGPGRRHPGGQPGEGGRWSPSSSGPPTFDSFDALLERTVAFDPTRSDRRCVAACCTTPST